MKGRVGSSAASGRRRLVWLGASAALLLGVVIASPGPVVRSLAQRKAERRGLVVAIDAVHWGWGAVWLEGVTIALPEVPSLKVGVRAVRVEPRGLGVGAIVLGGGSVELDGSVEALQQQLEQWRAHHTRERTGESASGPRIELSGLDLIWRNPNGPGSEARIWGLRAEHDAAHDRVQFDLARASVPGADLEVKAGAAELARHDGARLLESLSVRAVTVHAEPGALTAIERRLPGNDPATSIPSSPASGPAPVDPESAHRSFFGVNRLRAKVERLRGLLGAHLAPTAKLAIDELSFKLTNPESVLNIGPAGFSATEENRRLIAKLAPSAGASHETLALGLELPLDGGDTVLSLEGGPVSLAVLGIHEGDLWLRNVARTTLSAQARIVLPPSEGSVALEASGELHDWSLVQPKIAPDPIDGDRLGWKARATISAEGVLDLSELSLTVGRVTAKLAGNVARRADGTHLKLHGEVPLVECQAIAESVPAALLGALKEVSMAGTFSFSGNVDFDTERPDEIQVGWDAKNDCRIAAAGSDVSPDKFKRRFQYYVTDHDGVPMLRETGPDTDDWTPFDQISPMLETAVTICEDSRFRRHHGFDEEAIHNSLVANVKSGRFVRGASTISMQLAKNLYLGHEKTLSRKLQEAVLTMLLEQELSKDEILELYFNVVELGPDIFGIRQAAHYYFGIEPHDLSLLQSLYLASILPNPKHSHLDAEGKLNEAWADYLKKLMQIAHKIHRITDAELDQGLNDTLVVSKDHAAAPPTNAAGSGEAEPEDDVPEGGP